MQLDVLDDITEEEMHEEEKRDNQKEDQYSEEVEAMNREVDIIVAQLSSGSASSSDGAQVYWDKDGVWEE